jgi:exopolysaccharide biosynthesis protein
MKKIFQKPYRWAITYSTVLIASVTFVLLQTFVIPQAQSPAGTQKSAVLSSASAKTDGSTASGNSSGGSEKNADNTQAITDNTYKDANIQITIDTVRKYDTDIYIADIQVSSIDYLKTAFAKDTYGRNIKEMTSGIATDHNAIFAVNGDYYGFRDNGFVIRNGVLYRGTARQSGSDAALAIDSMGDFSIINESGTDAQKLVDNKVWQVLSFGPALVSNGEIDVTSNSEIGKAMSSNPRTAIGQVSPLHYIVIVSDGRTNKSAGLSLLQLAQEFKDRGCTVANNLDGGGSSTMWFNGQVVNNPTDGRSYSERSVSDIVYVGY